MAPSRPPFQDLPLDKNGPPGNAWGLYGPNDELGALNMITSSAVKAAAQEIQTGDRVSLDWYLNLPSHPSFNRPSFSWKMKNKEHPDGAKRTVNDDHLDFNTQGSSQWDGFRHYGYQSAKKYYGGRSQQDLESSEVIGIDRVANSGGITARGIILDYPRYLEKKGKKEVYALEANSITAEELEEMLQETGIKTRESDLLLLRTGFTRDYAKLGEEERRAIKDKPPTFLGVQSDKNTLQWIWENGFVAVASDAPSFEMSPLVGPHSAPGGINAGETWENEMQGGGLVHQWLLGGWGVMIGEMWDLERLCEKSKELGRSTCFVSSVPLKVPGGVASPPNAVAIF
ncbi:hypothetical protein J4E80_002072 [Alternaria sp. BMP 0032]|nr:hypothetical protein J4E80_002072 [Alternaria sp. BMP 0032]